MCGIVGLARPGGRVEIRDIAVMAEQLIHRGPDSFGAHAAGDVGVGVRRLRVIDLATGDQPIANEDGSVWAVLNGEIYNFEQLREDLKARGHRFNTRSDTEVVVHAYEEHGDDFVLLLRGMFALAVWDGRDRRLLIARDRLGKKPLLYTQVEGTFAFASEMRALLIGAAPPRELDLGAIGDYLAYGYVPGPLSALKGIRKLLPGHILTRAADGSVAVRSYWQPQYEPKADLCEAAALDELEHRIREAVRLRLIADVPIGALLSGGVDSSLVVAFMAQATSRVKTFSVGFDDASYDELAHARRVAERYGTDHHELVVRPDAAAILPTLVRHYGEPYGDSSAIPTYYVAQLAREHVTVALNGDGGDESFAGYDRYKGMALAKLVGGTPFARFAPPLAKIVPRLPAIAAGTKGRIARFLGAAVMSERDRYAMWVGTMPPVLWKELWLPEARAAADAERSRAVERAFDGARSLGPLDRLLATDLKTYLVDDLLVKMDIASMANSLETRSPLLDQEVVDFAAHLPERFKLGPRGEQKYLLKKLARRHVPAENIDRRKMGFGVPVGQWLRSSLNSVAEDALLGDRASARGLFDPRVIKRLWHEHQSGTRDRTLPLWTLFMLELWQREFIDRPTP